MKKLICLPIVLLFCFICSPVQAAETTDIDFSSVEDALPEEIEDKIGDIKIDDYEAVLETVGPENIFEEIIGLFKSGFKRPASVALSVIALLLAVSVISSFKPEDKTVDFVTTLGIISLAVMPTVSVINAFQEAIKSASVFLTAFIPIFAGIIAAKGRAVTAANFSSLMLLASQGLSSISSFIVIPLTGMQLSLSIGGSFVSGVNTSSLSKGVNKTSMWILSGASTVFLGVLGLQTLITAPADNVSTKTAKFVVGTAVPVVGNVVSEALGTFVGSLKLLGLSAAVYGIIVILMIMLPIIVDLLLWRLALVICRCAAELLSLPKAAELIRSAENCFSLVLGVSVLMVLLFVISIAVISAV